MAEGEGIWRWPRILGDHVPPTGACKRGRRLATKDEKNIIHTDATCQVLEIEN